MSIKHLVFSDSSKGLLNYAFSNTEHYNQNKIIAFTDMLTNGPIQNLANKNGVANRLTWLCTFIVESHEDKSLVDYYGSSYSIFNEISADDKVIIWHGENAVEMLSLMYAIKVLADYELYEMPVTELLSCSPANNGNLVWHTSELTPELVIRLMDNEKIISPNRINELINNWDELEKTQNILRIMENNQIISVNDDYYDNVIIANCSEDFETAGRIIGKSISDSLNNASETFLARRLLLLNNEGIVEIDGNLNKLYSCNVRLVK